MQSPALQNVFSQVLVANAVVQTTATPRNLLNFNLSAGVWLLTANIHWIPAATTNISILNAAFNAVTATMGTSDTSLVQLSNAAAGIVPVNPIDQSIAGFIINLPVAATFFLNTNATFTVAALTVSGWCNAAQISS